MGDLVLEIMDLSPELSPALEALIHLSQWG